MSKPICGIRGTKQMNNVGVLDSTLYAEYNVCVPVKYHPPLVHHLQGDLYSGLRFSLCLCHTEHAVSWDGDAVQFPVERKHLLLTE